MEDAAAQNGRTRYDIGEIVRDHREALEASVRLGPAERRVLAAMALCRTAALGGHLYSCMCGETEQAYNSCRDRHCPKCQFAAQERWIEARAERIVPARHFHVVLTIPRELRWVAMCSPRVVLDALMRAASETLVQLGRTRHGVELGVTTVLHTWTREMAYHPHVHALVSAGGLAEEGWRDIQTEFLFPLKVLGQVFRGKLLDALERAGKSDKLAHIDAPDLKQALRLASHRDWVVYVKKAFRRPEHVLEYLGRYTHRVAIANSRIEAVTATHITFRTKDEKTCTVSPVEFLRRFLLHVLPTGFTKIRHTGLYAPCKLKTDLARCHAELADRRQEMTANVAKNKAQATTESDKPLRPAAPELPSEPAVEHELDRFCQKCGCLMTWTPVAPTARAPPMRAAA